MGCPTKARRCPAGCRPGSTPRPHGPGRPRPDGEFVCQPARGAAQRRQRRERPMAVSAGKRIWGWYFFDWASQPYNTLLLTFIFGPYINELLGDGTAAQTAWGFGVGAAGLVIALLAPVLGAMADTARQPDAVDLGLLGPLRDRQRGAVVRGAGGLQPRADARLFRAGADRDGVRHDLHPRDAAHARPAGAARAHFRERLGLRLPRRARGACHHARRSSPKARPPGGPSWGCRPPSGSIRRRGRARASSAR